MRRRRFLAAGALAAATAGCLEDSSSTPTDGPTTGTPGGTPNDTPSDSPTSGTEPPSTPNSEALDWRRDLGSSVKARPATDGEAAYVGTGDGGVHAFDADGSRRWTFATDRPVRGVTATDAAVLVVAGSSGLGDDHVVHALDPRDGVEQWRFAPGQWWLEVLAVADGTVYVGTEDDAIGPAGERLYALDPASGDTRWSAEIGDPSGGLVAGDAVYVPASGRIYAYDTDGRRRWTRDGLEYGHRTITATSETVALVADTDDHRKRVFALSADDGSIRWTAAEDWFATSLTRADGTLFVGGQRLVATDLTTGEALWEDDAGGYLYRVPVDDGTLYAGGRAVRALAADDGSERWSFAPDFRLLDPAALVGGSTGGGGTLYVHGSKSRDDRNRHLFAVDPADGDERWEFEAATALTDPVVVGGRAVAASEDGTVYGFA